MKSFCRYCNKKQEVDEFCGEFKCKVCGRLIRRS